MKTWLISAAAGLLAVLPLVVALTAPGGLFFVLLVPLPLFLVGLSAGVAATLVAAAAGGALLLGMGGFWSLVGGLGMLFAPVAVLVRQALLSRGTADGGTEWYPPGLLAAWLAAIGMGLLLLLIAPLWAEGGGLEAQLRQALLERLQAMLAGLPPADVESLANRFASFGLGMAVLSWLLVLTVNAALAQGVLVRQGWNRRPSPTLADIQLPRWIGWALAAAAFGAVLLPGDAGFVARNLAVVLLLPFFLAGLAVVHTVCRRFQAKTLALTVFYVLLILLTWPAVLVAGLGLIDHWANIRGRGAAGGKGQEDE